jgi:FtsP/CotA-like multicopper oxidase with cupredoxin domain
MNLNRNRMRWIPVAIVLSLGGLLAQPGGSTAQAAADVRAVCTNGPNFSLVSDLGYIFTPDANTLAMWSYADTTNNGGAFQFPGPVMCLNEGQTATITLTNNLPEPTSIVFPGQDEVTAAGVPSEPVIAANGAITSLAPTAAANGGTITYSFKANHAGTFLYQSGTNPDKQREMGLFGAIIVRPADGSTSQIYGDASTTDDFTSGREFLQILSEADPAFHNAVEAGENPSPTGRVSKYYFINGRSMPDTLSPNNSPFLPAQPYSGLVHIIENEKAAIRYINAGRSNYPYHPHGNDTIVVGHDGVMLKGSETSDAGQDLSFPKFLVDLAPGQTVDATFTWTDVEHYTPTNPVPAVLPPIQQLGIRADTWYSMSPYLGVKNPSILPPGVTQTSECGEYYHMAHSHALEQSTNYGAAFGGMMTLYRIDPGPAHDPGPGLHVCP